MTRGSRPSCPPGQGNPPLMGLLNILQHGIITCCSFGFNPSKLLRKKNPQPSLGGIKRILILPVICRGCPPQLYFAESLLFLVQTRFYKMQPGPAQRLPHVQGKNKPEMQLHFEIPLFLKLFLLLQGSTSLCNTAEFSTHLHQALHLGTHPAASNPSPSFQKAFPVKNPFLFF